MEKTMEPMLGHFVYTNALFMCKRLWAEFPFENFCTSKLLEMMNYRDSSLLRLVSYLLALC
ncbi:unnamed protein product [Arabis nemorensis]|uniref:Uncharacterized protein n=1 Tax=Arabis nemorensis TaxID=586526 RepID=A0A565BAX4_9BRAS|nr:unnamed protein product [Arabis nemorensis]